MKILLVDDHPVFRSGMAIMMRNIFADSRIVEIGDSAGLDRETDKDELLDLVLLDLLFPGFNAVADFPALRRKLPLTPIVAVSMVHDDRLINAIMAAGANGFVSKTARADDISKAFLSVMDGETIVLRASSPGFISPDTNPLSQLTDRQLDVLRHVARGMTNKEIGRELGISPYTVRVHVAALFKALNVSSRSAAASFATARGFV